MVETRQTRRARQQQKLPVQPFAALDVFAGERFLPQLPEIVQTESTVPAVTTALTILQQPSPTTDPVQLPENTPTVPILYPKNGVKIMAAKCYVVSDYKKGKRIVGEKK